MDKFHNAKIYASTSKNDSNEKSIDADSMINNIISQQDTFVVNKDHQFYSNLPKWMIPKSGFVHPLYDQIWQYVKSDKRDRTCDTNLVSQLLMTSGLPIGILGKLWSMANIGVEGSLSQQELYIILALITLVQNGYSVSNVSLLQHIHKPIIPQLNYSLIEKKYNISTIKSNIEHKPQQIINKSNTVSKMNHQQENVYAKSFQQPNFNMISSEDPLAVTFIEPKNQLSRTLPSLTANLEPKSLDLAPVNKSFETFDDEFSDFQCAKFSYSDAKSNHEFTDFQSAFDSLSFKKTPTKSIENEVKFLNVSPVNSTTNVFKNESSMINYEDNDVYDKYEVFRTLASETVDIKDLANDNQDNLNIHKDPNCHNSLMDVNIKPPESIEDTVKNYDVYDDEFGDFLCVEEISKNIPEEIEIGWENVQVQCINKCLEFLQEGFSTFSSISNEKVLMEVINHDKGMKYLTQLKLISQICKQILESCHCPSLKDNFTNVMLKLENYMIYFTQDSTDNLEVLDSTNEVILCYLCKSNCKTDSTEYMLNHYHSSCINLLINFVKTSFFSFK